MTFGAALASRSVELLDQLAQSGFQVRAVEPLFGRHSSTSEHYGLHKISLRPLDPRFDHLHLEYIEGDGPEAVVGLVRAVLTRGAGELALADLQALLGDGTTPEPQYPALCGMAYLGTNEPAPPRRRWGETTFGPRHGVRIRASFEEHPRACRVDTLIWEPAPLRR